MKDIVRDFVMILNVLTLGIILKDPSMTVTLITFKHTAHTLTLSFVLANIVCIYSYVQTGHPFLWYSRARNLIMAILFIPLVTIGILGKNSTVLIVTLSAINGLVFVPHIIQSLVKKRYEDIASYLDSLSQKDRDELAHHIRNFYSNKKRFFTPYDLDERYHEGTSIGLGRYMSYLIRHSDLLPRTTFLKTSHRRDVYNVLENIYTCIQEREVLRKLAKKASTEPDDSEVAYDFYERQRKFVHRYGLTI